jgi:hypothetical protein
VAPAATSVALVSSASLSAFGQGVTFTATVNSSLGNPTGTVTFAVDGFAQPNPATLANGQATLTLATLSPGTHSITATYSGGAGSNFANSNASLSQQVFAASTTTTLVSSSVNPTVGDSVTFTATVSTVAPGKGVPAGSVVFTIDGVDQAPVQLNASGQATLTLNTLTSGSHSILATHVSTTNFQSSTAALGQQVSPAPTTLTLNTPVISGQTATLTATVSSSAGSAGTSGTVAFFVDGQQVGTANVVNGMATFTASNLGVGSHTFSASFVGTGQAAGSSSVSTGQTAQVSSTSPGNNGTTTTTTAVALKATIRTGAHHSTDLRVTAIDRQGHIVSTSGLMKVKVLRAPHGGRLRFSRTTLRLHNGVAVGGVTGTVPGTYTLRLTFGKLSTLATVHVK